MKEKKSYMKTKLLSSSPTSNERSSPKDIHNMQINCCTGPGLLSEYRWRKQTAGMRRGGDPWSAHALKNTRMKSNQRIKNILYRIQ